MFYLFYSWGNPYFFFIMCYILINIPLTKPHPQHLLSETPTCNNGWLLHLRTFSSHLAMTSLNSPVLMASKLLAWHSLFCHLITLPIGISWRRKWQPTPVFLSEKSHGQRNLVGYSPWGYKRVGHDWLTKQQKQHRYIQFRHHIFHKISF